MQFAQIKMSTIPTIYLNDPSRKETAAKLRKACIETGFFYLDGHSIPLHFLDKVFEQSKTFFNLPSHEKKKLTDKSTNRGYTAFEEQALDTSLQTDRGDTKEGFYIAKHIPKEDPAYNPTKFRGPNVYPDGANSTIENPTEFRDVVDSYQKQMANTAFEVVQLLALALHLPEHYFDEYFKDPVAKIRLLHYSQEKSDPSNGIFACGAHSDWGMLTLLLTDSSPGLQILYNNEWFLVPPKRGVFIVNLGDMLERWTNGLFRSTIHRVISCGEKERYSIPFFYEPNFDTLVECLDGCWGEGNPKRYKSVTMGEFITAKYLATHKEYGPSETS